MRIELHAPVVLTTKSYDDRYLLNLSITSPAISAKMEIDESVRIDVVTPCKSLEYHVITESNLSRTYASAKLDLKSFCESEKAVVHLLYYLSKTRDPLAFDDIADYIPEVETKSVLKALTLGGASLFFKSERYRDVYPIIYLPPPPGLQVIAFRGSSHQISYYELTRRVKATTLLGVLGLVSSMWKNDEAAIGEYLSVISNDLYGDEDYIANPPLIPISEDGVYLALLPKIAGGCESKLAKYRESLMERVLRNVSDNILLTDLSTGITLIVKDNGG